MTKTTRNVVGGESVDAASQATYDVVNPANGQVYATAPPSGPEDVDRAFRAAEAAADTWGETTPSERQRALLTIAAALEERTAEFVKVECENAAEVC